MKISREIKTAILVLFGIALFIYLFTFLQGDDLFSKKNTYYTEFDYNALSKSSPVTVKGNSVGRIEEIKYNFETGKTRVSFSVNPKLQFSKNSIIRLYETGLMGGNAIAIVVSNEGEMAQPGDFIPSEVEAGLVTSLKSNFSGISSDLDSSIRTADTLMKNLNSLVIDGSDGGLKSTISELNKTLKSFKNLSSSVQGVIEANDKTIAAIMASVDSTGRNLTILSKELKDAGLSNTIAELNTTLKSMQGVLSNLENGQGTIGKLLKDDALYTNLDNASKELQLLLLDIKLHPARYRRILSKREIPYEEPTDAQINNN